MYVNVFSLLLQTEKLCSPIRLTHCVNIFFKFFLPNLRSAFLILCLGLCLSEEQADRVLTDGRNYERAKTLATLFAVPHNF